jgi:hypothetical protein
MKTLLLYFALLAGASAAPPAVSLTGTLTNTTAGVAAPARLEIVRDGTTLSARLVTLPPLSGTGALQGICLDGWCELGGKLDGGFAVKLHGVMNAASFRGTYVVTPASGPTQYGRFEFSPPAAGKGKN